MQSRGKRQEKPGELPTLNMELSSSCRENFLVRKNIVKKCKLWGRITTYDNLYFTRQTLVDKKLNKKNNNIELDSKNIPYVAYPKLEI